MPHSRFGLAWGAGLYALLAFILLGTGPAAGGWAAQEQVFDLVLVGGRVMDPESGLDAVRNLGLRRGRIAAVSSRPLRARETLNVSGLVVAPGFIDLHTHGQDPKSNRLQARDGVTTALDVEFGVYPVKAWYDSREGKALVNYGATVGHIPARLAVTNGLEVGHIFTNTNLPPGVDPTKLAAASRPATAEELAKLAGLIQRGLAEGAVGVGFGLAYTPQASRAEVLEMFRVAASYNAPCYVHVRSAGAIEPGSSIEAVQEVVADAVATGAPLHIVHIGSSGLRQIRECLALIEGARRRGLDVTTEVYPYTATSTYIQSGVYDPGWQERMGITYQDLQWVATGERLTKETFDRYRKEGGLVIGHSIPAEVVDAAIAHPLVMIASDGIPFTTGKEHPRGAGTFARVLGRYVREQKKLTLMDALRKMTLQPARRLEGVVPTMKAKGRIKVGADADLAIFDPDRVIDRATFEQSAQPSEGVIHVLVGGTFVVKDSALVENVFPGQAIRGARAR